MLAFLDHPDQWKLFRAERPVTAVDEIVRWATPVTVFQRTTLADTTLGGQPIKAGQRVGLFYRSANFDESVFSHPERFDILRNPIRTWASAAVEPISASVPTWPGWRSS